MSCKSTSGIVAVGGLNESFWIVQKSDLRTQINTKQLDDISSIDFFPYKGLVRFDGYKFQNSFVSSLVVDQSKGLRYYAVTLNIKLFSGSTETDVIIQNLCKPLDTVAIVQDNMRRFFILGAGNGLHVTSDDQGSGVKLEDFLNDQITFVGKEEVKPLRFNVGDYKSTIDYLNNNIVQEVEIFDDSFDDTFN